MTAEENRLEQENQGLRETVSLLQEKLALREADLAGRANQFAEAVDCDPDPAASASARALAERQSQ